METPEKPGGLPGETPLDQTAGVPAKALTDPSEKEPPPPKKRTIFISHAHQDSAFAIRLATDLRAAGVIVWIDKARLYGGDSFDDRIRDAIRRNSEFLLVLSPDAVRSRYVQDELRLALKEGKIVVPVCHLPCEMPWRIAGMQWVDFISSYDDGFAQLMRAGERQADDAANDVNGEGSEVGGAHQVWWTRMLRSSSAGGLLRPLLALLAFVIGLGLYLLRPGPANHHDAPIESQTSLTVRATGDSRAFSVDVQNQGAKPSTLLGPFRLRFGELPIQDDTLDFPDAPTKSVIPAHASVTISLTTKSGFGPKLQPDGSWLIAKEIARLMPGKNVRLEIDVQESDDPLPARPSHTRSTTFPVDRIKNFVLHGLPTVPRGSP